MISWTSIVRYFMGAPNRATTARDIFYKHQESYLEYVGSSMDVGVYSLLISSLGLAGILAPAAYNKAGGTQAIVSPMADVATCYAAAGLVIPTP